MAEAVAKPKSAEPKAKKPAATKSMGKAPENKSK